MCYLDNWTICNSIGLIGCGKHQYQVYQRVKFQNQQNKYNLHKQNDWFGHLSGNKSRVSKSRVKTRCLRLVLENDKLWNDMKYEKNTKNRGNEHIKWVVEVTARLLRHVCVYSVGHVQKDNILKAEQVNRQYTKLAGYIQGLYELLGNKGQ